LKALSAVTDLVDAKITPVKARQRAALPYITYQRISRVPANHSTGTTATNETRIQVDCCAATYDGALALADAVRGDEDETEPTGLSGYNDPSGSVWHLENESDFTAPLRSGQDEVEAHIVSMDFLVWSG